MLTFIKTKWKLILRALFFLSLLALLAAGAYYIYWINFVQIQPKTFSGITLYRQPVIVTVDDHTKELNSFETYEFTLTTTDEVNIKVNAKSGELIAEQKHQPKLEAGIAVDYFIEDKNVQQCYILANVTPLFYPKPGQAQEVVSYAKLQAENNSVYYQHGTGYINDIYLYPGKYSGQDLPAELLLSQRVLGVYAVDCATVDDKAKINEQVLWWTHYDPSQQRDLYQQKLQELAAQ